MAVLKKTKPHSNDMCEIITLPKQKEMLTGNNEKWQKGIWTKTEMNKNCIVMTNVEKRFHSSIQYFIENPPIRFL